MRRIAKVLLWCLAGLLVVLSAGAVFLATAGDPFYRWALKQAIEGNIDRQIVVDGSYSLEMGLEPTLIATDVWMANASWASTPEMARARRIEVQLALLPLFSGVVRLPRLVVEGLTVDLETSESGEGNWLIAADGRDEPGDQAQGSGFYPIVEFYALSDISVTYRDRQGDEDLVIVIDQLVKEERGAGTGVDVSGEGSVNGRPVQITGAYGSIEDALQAAEPYPIALTLQSTSVTLDVDGTIADLPAGQGADVAVTLHTPTIERVFQSLYLDVPLTGRAEAAARLVGDLDALAVEDIVVSLVDQAGQELRASGRVANLNTGEGVDLQVSGALGSEGLDWIGAVERRYEEDAEEDTSLDVSARVTGDALKPNIEGLQAQLLYGSGVQLTVKGDGTLDLAGGESSDSRFEATALLFLPDRTPLERLLEHQLPKIGALRASAELVWEQDEIVLQSGELDADAFAQAELDLTGRIARFSAEDFAFSFEPDITVSAQASQLRPILELYDTLVADAAELPEEASAITLSRAELIALIQTALAEAGQDPGAADGKMGPKTRTAIERYQATHALPVDGQASQSLLTHIDGALGREPLASSSRLAEMLPELGPILASVRVFPDGDGYALDDVDIALGEEGGPRIRANGTLGTLYPEREPLLESVALEVSFSSPTLQPFAAFLPDDTPSLSNVNGRFAAAGSLEVLSIANLKAAADGPDGLTVAATGSLERLTLGGDDISLAGLSVNVEARSPTTEAVATLAEVALPELGPVRAKAVLKDRGRRFLLNGIDVAAGSEDSPVVQVTGNIGDLVALRALSLAGDFDVPTEALIGTDGDGVAPGLGRVQGNFELSDSDGSIGLEAISAEIEGTSLFSLSVKGVFDDLRQRDELWMEAMLSVPDLPQLGREFGLSMDSFSSLEFDGRASGSDELTRADGKLRLGETDFIGTFSGTLKDDRPILQAQLTSPRLRLVDIGLTPQPEDEGDLGQAGSGDGAPQSQRVFGVEPIGFEALRDFDLELEILLEDVEGVHLDLNRVEGRVSVKDGLLTVEPLAFNFVGGQVDASLSIDARGETPKQSLALAADDVDLGDFLAQTEVEVPLDGDMDLLVDLAGTGESPHDIASSLTGEFDLALQHGHVRTGLLRLAATNIVSWLFTADARQGYSDMNCLIVRLDVQDGLAESEALLLDTPNVRALGVGTIDLDKEFIDTEVDPEPKRGVALSGSTPFAIRGPLASPDIVVSTGGTAVRTLRDIVTSPLSLLGSLLPFAGGGNEKDNACLALEQGLARQ